MEELNANLTCTLSLWSEKVQVLIIGISGMVGNTVFRMISEKKGNSVFASAMAVKRFMGLND